MADTKISGETLSTTIQGTDNADPDNFVIERAAGNKRVQMPFEVDASGNIGLGTDTPDANTKLDLVGIIRASGGIQPNANAYSASEVLDDYEEGTFTPTITCVTPGDLSVAYTDQLGRYTKIGDRVYYSIKLTTSTFTHTTASGDIQLAGLPFTSVVLSHNVDAQVLMSSKWTAPTDYSSISGGIVSNSSIINVYKQPNNGNGIALVSITEFVTASNPVFNVAGHYGV